MHLNHPLEPRNPGHQVNSPAHRVGSLEPPVSSPALQDSNLAHLENNPAHRVSSLALQVNSPAHRKLLKATRLLMPMSLQRSTNLPKDMSPLKTTRNPVKSQGFDNFQLLPQKVAEPWQAGGKSGKRG